MKKSLAALLGTLVLLAAVAYFAAQPLIVWYVMPPATFNTADQSLAPDYADLTQWAAHPATASAAKLRPAGAAPPLQATGLATRPAVFYVHPTTWFGPGEWNDTPQASNHAKQGIETMLATGASAFSDCCDLYAPRFRQAHIAVFNRNAGAHGFASLDLAYEDVARAFDAFLEDIGQRPFLLAGHSQGTLHLQRLLSERISGSPLLDRMAVAYLIGYWLPRDLAGRNFPDVPYCTSAAMTGCIVTWDSYRSDGLGPAENYELPIWYRDGWAWHNRAASICINPLSWQQDTARVEAARNLGALPTLPAGGQLDFLLGRDPGVRYEALPEIIAEHSGAQCDEAGRLRLTGPVHPAFEDEGATPEGSMHRYDWNLFYMNLRANIGTRTGAVSAGL
jgi:hypothetical protein